MVGRTLVKCIMIQLMVDGVITEPGQNVQLNVEEEHKPEPGLAQTQLQLMVVLIVLGRQLKVKIATHNLVQVNIACIYHFHKYEFHHYQVIILLPESEWRS